MFRAFATIGLLALLAYSSAQADSPPGSARPVRLEVYLPADALLSIDTTLTKSGGSARTYISPPLAQGKNYLYTLEATWQGKVAVVQVQVTAGQTQVVQFRPVDFRGTTVAEGKGTGDKATAHAKDGFFTVIEEGRLWIFREGSKELAEFKKQGTPEVHVTRVNAAPLKMTVKAPDTATLQEYLTAKPGFVTQYHDGRIWVFRKGSKELAAFQKQGDLEIHITRTGAGPDGMTLKAPDRETLDAYLKAGAR